MGLHVQTMVDKHSLMCTKLHLTQLKVYQADGVPNTADGAPNTADGVPNTADCALNTADNSFVKNVSTAAFTESQ